MTLQFDPYIQQVLAAGAGPRGSSRFAAWHPGDVYGLRLILNDGLSQLAALPSTPSVQTSAFTAQHADGTSVDLRWYRKDESAGGPAVVFFHGGARIAGSVDLYDPLVRMLVDWAGVPFLSVEYRLAPEAGGAAAVHDGLLAVEWLIDHHETLDIDPARIAVMGDSAGGGIAAGVAVLARDTGIELARQILIYPMLDDRTVSPDVELSPAAAMFSYEFNRTAWESLLDDVPRDSADHLLAAPARTPDLRGVAPAYIEVGELDIFRDEDVRYAQQLWRAGVATDLHVRSGYPHAFDVLLLGSPSAVRHRDERVRVLQSF
ncbi:acetyl esterase/lipase [Microbacterium halimionae]|uniref:Acetyl esterase/lipase n=1 Tax=Microbacterium halimionae TaxID=1526413 RepID=A0A7W3PL43_9MICO|nr:alpha/beta hydrolase [Microbacterium halimionae]MBA8815562.1 acetyl esterase/lipase [Microbacterium halimionae]NII95608.1 acetyl esterase/lipase [Microbacterium halimionae]